MFSSTKPSQSNHRSFRLLQLSLFVATLILLASCGSTKVYNNDKTIVYRGNLYNVSSVQQMGSEVTAKLPDGSVVDITNADKNKIKSLLKENGSMFVSMDLKLDSKEIPYRANTVKKYSDYSRMKSDFESAQKKIVKLMADKKKMQLKLK